MADVTYIEMLSIAAEEGIDTGYTTPAYFARAGELPLARGGWGLSVDTHSCSAKSPVGDSVPDTKAS